MQEGVNAQGIFRQVRAALSVTPYSCVYVINALRMTLRGSVVLQEYLSKSRASCSLFFGRSKSRSPSSLSCVFSCPIQAFLLRGARPALCTHRGGSVPRKDGVSSEAP